MGEKLSCCAFSSVKTFLISTNSGLFEGFFMDNAAKTANSVLSDI